MLIKLYVCTKKTAHHVVHKTAKDILSEISFRNVYDTLRERLENYATYLVRDREAGRDIVSHAFISALQHPAPLGEKDIHPFLFKVVHNLCLNYRRDTARHRDAHMRILQRERSAHLSYNSLLEKCDPSDVLASEISKIWLQQLSDLPNEIRKTYLLRCEGLSYKEIAKQLGIKENKVDKNLRKALAVLKHSLSDYINKD